MSESEAPPPQKALAQLTRAQGAKAAKGAEAQQREQKKGGRVCKRRRGRNAFRDRGTAHAHLLVLVAHRDIRERATARCTARH